MTLGAIGAGITVRFELPLIASARDRVAILAYAVTGLEAVHSIGAKRTATAAVNVGLIAVLLPIIASGVHAGSGPIACACATDTGRTFGLEGETACALITCSLLTFRVRARAVRWHAALISVVRAAARSQ